MDLLTYAMAKSNTESEIAEAKQAAETAALSAEEASVKAESAAERAETVKMESDRIANEVKQAAANAAASAEQAKDTVQNVSSQISQLSESIVEIEEAIGFEVVGKNLLKFEDKLIIVNPASDTQRYGIEFEGVGTFTFSCENPKEYELTYRIIENGQAGAYALMLNRLTFTLEKGQKMIFYMGRENLTWTMLEITNVQIERGSKKTEYEPYSSQKGSKRLIDIENKINKEDNAPSIFVPNKYEKTYNVTFIYSNNAYYLTKSPSALVGIYHLNMNKGDKVKIDAQNCDRCRIGFFDIPFEEIVIKTEYGGEVGPDITLATEVVVYDDALTAYKNTYTAQSDGCLVLYFSKDDVETVKIYRCLADDIYIENVATEEEHKEFNAIVEFTPFSVDYSCIASTLATENKNDGEDNRIMKIEQSGNHFTNVDFINTFYDCYLGYHGDVFCGKKVLGRDESGLYDIWQYEFKPVSKEIKHTILLSAGMHTTELPAAFGLARWIKEYMESDADVFNWLRKNVRIIVIPIVNPWGWNQTVRKYANCNGVNPNRNFDTWKDSWENFPTYSANPADANYNEWNVKGSAPFSEKETQVLRDWLNNNVNAEFWIDCHTGVGVPGYEVWCLYQSTNPLAGKINYAIDKLSRRIEEKYGGASRNNIQIDAETSIKIEFSTDDVGIPMLVIEQSGYGMRYGTSLNNEAIKITEYATSIHAYIISMLR